MTTTKNGKTKPTNRIAGKTAAATSSVIEIPALNNKRITFKLVGVGGPLVQHNFCDSTKAVILHKQMTKDAKIEKVPRSPEMEFLNSLHWVNPAEMPLPESFDDQGRAVYDAKKVAATLKKAKFGIPLTAIAGALVAACRNIDGLTMKGVQQQFFVESPVGGKYAIIESGPPVIDSSVVTIGNNIKQERFRGRFDEWSTKVIVAYDANMLSASSIASLLATAGCYCGLLEGRPEKKSRLGWGRFEIQ
jgi:hypothetical protein